MSQDKDKEYNRKVESLIKQENRKINKKDNPIKQHIKKELIKEDAKNTVKINNKEEAKAKELGVEYKEKGGITGSRSPKAKIYRSTVSGSNIHKGEKEFRGAGVFQATGYAKTAGRYQKSKIKEHQQKRMGQKNSELSEDSSWKIKPEDKKVRWGKVAHDVAIPTRVIADSSDAASLQLKNQEAKLKHLRNQVDLNDDLNKGEKAAAKTASYVAQAPIMAIRKTLSVTAAAAHTTELASQPAINEAKKIGASIKAYVKNDTINRQANKPDKTPSTKKSGDKGQSR